MNANRKSRRTRGASAAVRLCASLCLLLIAACTATSTSVPVDRREARAAVHVVQPGETLSKIAWQHRVDQAELAAWNGIADLDSLRVGQRLRLVPPARRRSRAGGARRARAVAPAAADPRDFADSVYSCRDAAARAPVAVSRSAAPQHADRGTGAAAAALGVADGRPHRHGLRFRRRHRVGNRHRRP